MMEILLLDAAHLQEEDAYYLNKEGKTRHKPALPLFTQDDARAVSRLVKPVSLSETVQLSPHLSFSLRPVGHILGACSVLLTVRDGGQAKTVCFGGDIGRYGAPLVPDPQSPLASDYLILESTYGDRRHEAADPYETIAGLVQQIVERKGVLLIPAFAVGRTQQIVLILRELEEQGRIPRLPIHVDSPMAVNATEIYCEFEKWHRLDLARLGGAECALHAKNITYHRTREESMAINKLDGPRIIISAGGMLTGGRVLHHLMQRMDDQENIIALVGFQAEGTRGRDLLDGKKILRYHGEMHTVRAQIADVGGLSGHADYTELMRWLGGLKKAPQTTFITHGEPGPAAAMAARVQEERRFKTVIPSLGDEFEL
jgi:metallo-beta-lactamase family protein